jgi:aspartate kinase
MCLLPDEPARSVVSVVKLGGSVLVDVPAYRAAADALTARAAARPDERLVVVVSAREGVTDALSALARTLTRRPKQRALDLLWSTGEIESVALLTIALQDAGADALGLNVHELGLRFCDVVPEPSTGVVPGFSRGPIFLHGDRVRAAVRDHQIVVVPGFIATDDDGAIVSLGRGGSDLTAVLLAAELGAACELVKDVPGYFSADPNRDPAATPLPALTYDDALAMAEKGCDLVQPRALEAAARAAVALVVRSLADQVGRTIVAGSHNHVGSLTRPDILVPLEPH